MMRTLWLTAALLVSVCSVRPAAAAGDEVYGPPTAEELRGMVDDWLLKKRLENSPIRDAIDPLWQFEGTATTEQLFDALMRTFYYADNDVRNLVDACRALTPSAEMPDVSAFRSRVDEPLLANNVQYFFARHLAVLNLYEESLAVLGGVEPHALVDPASYFFYKAVCEHHLLLKDDGLQSVSRLLHDTEQVPVRYQKVGELMQHDLEQVQEKSLGEVARQMRDVERRLDLGRTGQQVQRVEERIIATLDEIIEKLEQQGGGGGGGGGQSQGQPSGSPADDSYLGGVKGPGQTDRKDIGHKDGWGDLPPKAQTAAKNMLDRQFPPHYRQAVEEYLKKAAERPAP